MNQPLFFAWVGAALFGIGLYGLLVHGHLMRKIVALNVMGNGVFLVFIALARRDPLVTDPIPHAMVLTGLVISVSATAFALVLLKRLARQAQAQESSEHDS
ncbi:MAG: cation:proton antiporter subunit C [Candidatus Competibacteraceae bacterium]|jgi:multicomponent Na+:H+ antiporter subunit C|nr:cation:proton antiporter subunit C [Candidatus Competibacteraceae bacterium]